MTHSNQSLDAVIRRIQKITALANNNPNEEERIVAMRMAAKLLTKYNLDMQTVENHASESEVTEEELTACTEKWALHIISTACQLYYCRYFLSVRQSGKRKCQKPVIIGTKANTTIAIEMANWLTVLVRRESNARFVTPQERRACRLGAAARLYTKAQGMIRDEAQEQIVSAATGSALMVLRNQLDIRNDHYLAEKYPNLRASPRRSSRVNAHAYLQGKSYGDTINLSRQVTGTARAALK